MPARSVMLAAALVVALPSGVPAQGAAVARAAGVEGVAVSSSGRPEAGVAVYLDAEGLPEKTARTPGAAEVPVIDQESLRFDPTVVVVQRGTRVDFLNSDPILHNVFSPGWSGEGFDLGTYPSGQARSHVFREEGPHVILCHVHPEMAAYVVVVATPYHDVTDGEGRFSIEGVPPGRYRLKVWRRGAETREEALVVPSGGRRDLVLELSGSGGVVRGERP